LENDELLFRRKKKQVFVGMFVYNLQQPDKRIHLGESPYAMSGESNDE
jgi:hypothetical protein